MMPPPGNWKKESYCGSFFPLLFKLASGLPAICSFYLFVKPIFLPLPAVGFYGL